MYPQVSFLALRHFGLTKDIIRMAHFQIVRETCISQLYLLFMSLWYRAGIFSPPFISSDIYPHSFEHFLHNYSFLSLSGGKFFCKGPDSNYLGYADHMVSVTIQLCSHGLNTGIDSRKIQKLGCVLKKTFFFFFFFHKAIREIELVWDTIVFQPLIYLAWLY